ncbi:hypothetical protein SEA_YEEZY_68 [Gordonia phage Yeezy]|uniref:DUF4326 domain-containing protein n=1 Tax=Gordonia phage Yeezy TaxID=1821565 RepID=A0A142K9N0_9CAUD|nr:hypothetical protein SEA_YEEZY_68 [Gordonia phage Yeezy]AMS02813.1 hypothetical protein SEA_YEEZY_68 [Gordonia phage Yeezy]
MTAPQRIQRRRTKGWRMPEGAVYVGRPTRWGNPFALGSPSGLVREPAVDHPGHDWEYEGRISAAGMRHDYHHADGTFTVVNVRAMTAAESVECYRAYVSGGGWPIDWKPFSAPSLEEIRTKLRGRDLVCWCPLDQPCHADVLLELANGGDR